MGFKLLGDMIAVKRVEQEEKPSLLIIPKQEEKQFIGEVFMVGPGQIASDGTLYPTSIKPGEQVIYLSTTGFHVKDKVSGEMYTLMYERDVIAVLTEDVLDPKPEFSDKKEDIK